MPRMIIQASLIALAHVVAAKDVARANESTERSSLRGSKPNVVLPSAERDLETVSRHDEAQIGVGGVPSNCNASSPS
jgi:hypothetical protein